MASIAPGARGAMVTSQDVWCLAPGNIEDVIRTARLLGLGTPAQDGLIKPRDSDAAVPLEKWRSERLADFRKACKTTFKAFRSDDLSQADVEALDDEDDLSADAQIGLTAGSTLLAGLLGAGAGYGFNVLSRREERGHAAALEVGGRLIALSAFLDVVVRRTRSGQVTGEDTGTARSLAVQLRGSIPSSATSADSARTAIDELIAQLDTSTGDHEADARNRAEARGKVDTHAGDVVKELGGEAPPALPQDGDKPDEASETAPG